MPPRFRLACQYFVRDEDIFVTFEGDNTLPSKGPSLSIAASIYKGGLEINTLDAFLNFAMKVEDDAAIHYDDLAATMKSHGNEEVSQLFLQLAGYSRRHYAEVERRMATSGVAINLPSSTLWPDNVTPETSAIWAGDAHLSRLDALKAALQGERRGYEFYYAVAYTSSKPEIVKAAKEFVKEEAEHVETLKQWIEREEAAARTRAAAQLPA
jgi:rubrerythrin